MANKEDKMNTTKTAADHHQDMLTALEKGDNAAAETSRKAAAEADGAGADDVPRGNLRES